MRRVHVSTKSQVAAVSVGSLTMGLSLFAAAQLVSGTPAVATAVATNLSNSEKVAAMSARVAAMQAEIATIRSAATAHAARLDARQSALDALVTGEGEMPRVLPAAAAVDPAKVGSVIAPFASVEARQNALALRLAAVSDAQYRTTVTALQRVGLDPVRFHRGAMGGPLELVPAQPPVMSSAAKANGDPEFRALFKSWKRLEQLQQGVVAIPSKRPTETGNFTSGFGVRSDPFGRGAAMHAGVDIAAPTGTLIYATADGIVTRAGWANGYGNLVEIDHGKGIQTRYGHLSRFDVRPGTRVVRGQLIARMGSTGRSTGSHLHYEVRLDGHAVNPMPFIQSANYLMAMQERARGVRTAMGGPKDAR